MWTVARWVTCIVTSLFIIKLGRYSLSSSSCSWTSIDVMKSSLLISFYYFLLGADYFCPCRQLSTRYPHARHRLIFQMLTLILYHPSVSVQYVITKMSWLYRLAVSSNKTRISYQQYKTASTPYSYFSTSHKLISHSSLSSTHIHWFPLNFIIRSILSSSLSVRQSRFGLILGRCLSVRGRLVVIG